MKQFSNRGMKMDFKFIQKLDTTGDFEAGLFYIEDNVNGTHMSVALKISGTILRSLSFNPNRNSVLKSLFITVGVPYIMAKYESRSLTYDSLKENTEFWLNSEDVDAFLKQF